MFYTCGFTFNQLAFYVEQTEKVSIIASIHYTKTRYVFAEMEEISHNRTPITIIVS